MSDSFRRSSVGRPIKMELFREWVMIIGILFLVSVVAVVLFKNISLKNDLLRKESGLYRSPVELESGVKRFMDYFYSINSGTVRKDQFRAVNMLVDPGMQRDRVRYISENDIVRTAEKAGIRSEIDWPVSEVTKIGDGDPEFSSVFECKLVLIIHDKGKRSVHRIDVVVTVAPVEKSDMNIEGIGILAFSDLAYDPFAKGDK